eukprot:2985417-Ditylum_brightwellii.AAC.1
MVNFQCLHHPLHQQDIQPLWYKKSTTPGNYDIMAACKATSKVCEYKEAGALNSESDKSI